MSADPRFAIGPDIAERLVVLERRIAELERMLGSPSIARYATNVLGVDNDDQDENATEGFTIVSSKGIAVLWTDDAVTTDDEVAIEAGVVAGQRLLVEMGGPGTVTIVNGAGVFLPGGQDFTLIQMDVVEFWWSAANSGWMISDIFRAQEWWP
jgi:hypothetical protein